MEFRFIEMDGIKKDAYLISEQGDIFSLLTMRFIVPSIDKHGYLKLHLQSQEGKKKTLRVHRLVAITFVEKSIDLKNPTVDHVDHNKLNNDYHNLRWIEMSSNCRNQQHKVGGYEKKLTKNKVNLIRGLLEEGISTTKIAELFDVSYYTIRDIKQGKTWVHNQ